MKSFRQDELHFMFYNYIVHISIKYSSKKCRCYPPHRTHIIQIQKLCMMCRSPTLLYEFCQVLIIRSHNRHTLPINTQDIYSPMYVNKDKQASTQDGQSPPCRHSKKCPQMCGAHLQSDTIIIFNQYTGILHVGTNGTRQVPRRTTVEIRCTLTIYPPIRYGNGVDAIIKANVLSIKGYLFELM